MLCQAVPGCARLCQATRREGVAESRLAAAQCVGAAQRRYGWVRAHTQRSCIDMVIRIGSGLVVGRQGCLRMADSGHGKAIDGTIGMVKLK